MRRSFGGARIATPQAGDEGEIFQRRQLVIDHRLVGHPGDELLGGHRVAQRIDAQNMDRPRVGAQQASDHAQRCRLAGAIRAEQRIEFAGTDGEIETVHRQAVETLR